MSLTIKFLGYDKKLNKNVSVEQINWGNINGFFTTNINKITADGTIYTPYPENDERNLFDLQLLQFTGEYDDDGNEIYK